jgi:hypothetical protein
MQEPKGISLVAFKLLWTRFQDYMLLLQSWNLGVFLAAHCAYEVAQQNIW